MEIGTSVGVRKMWGWVWVWVWVEVGVEVGVGVVRTTFR
jgi:hypothetical protein